ncbi:MAG: hypothetical protein OEU36_02770 [Gammaproteobacteria bacterium]|nr:hypothetical protein [Gammaproteobacteria bacterium]
MMVATAQSVLDSLTGDGRAIQGRTAFVEQLALSTPWSIRRAAAGNGETAVRTLVSGTSGHPRNVFEQPAENRLWWRPDPPSPGTAMEKGPDC